ncbi:MAG: type II toxin-antitoxin system VapC family toxin [Syntrophobacteraceae bacterium]|nr:type II toxin-antitoxin system VapC family toxin [Syntrophobacteraceae bacterium]
MKIAYLVDTDWIIHYLLGAKPIRKELLRLRPEGLAISIVSLAEVYEGVLYSRDPETSGKGLAKLLKNISILGLDEDICRVFAKERGKLGNQGNLIGDFDLLIASTCLLHGLTLLTNIVRHSKRIDGLRLISMTV